MLRRNVPGTLIVGFALVVACGKDEASPTPSGTSTSSSSTSSTSSSSGATSSSSSSSSSFSGSSGDASADAPNDAPSGAFTLTSSAFAEGGTIPLANAKCPGGTAGNQSPPLAWTGAPGGTQSFAIIVRDISLATANNYHWVIYDIPATTTSLPAGVAAQAAPPTPAGAKQTYWSFSNDYSYQGPCPPNEHTYEFTLYALPTATAAVPANTTSPSAAAAVITAAATSSTKLAGKYKQ